MNWSEFKAKVDAKLESHQINGDEIEIEWIDIHCPEEGDFSVNINQGSDDRLEMQIS